ncbi:MAG: ribonuclease P protein component [Elusimicrobia bacterium RIFOXYB2_FULL_48_7]|nr:MAG: ribonuclease P protein component [Elusimicrobia bacterium RIFOXYB2_FULL_48_7]
MKLFSFRKEDKLRHSPEFKRVFKNGKAMRSSGIVMFVYRRSASGPGHEIKRVRVGIVLSRKVGNAVARNRLKRQLREIFRLNKHFLDQGVDIVFLAREKLPSFDYGKLKDMVFGLWERAKVINQ